MVGKDIVVSAVKQSAPKSARYKTRAMSTAADKLAKHERQAAFTVDVSVDSGTSYISVERLCCT